MPLPRSLDGQRCIDIGTCDGFWAFELERRGAKDVVGIDLSDPGARDWPYNTVGDRGSVGHNVRAKTAFQIASEALGSNVERLDLSIYDLSIYDPSPETTGQFDFAFLPIEEVARAASVPPRSPIGRRPWALERPLADSLGNSPGRRGLSPALGAGFRQRP